MRHAIRPIRPIRLTAAVLCAALALPIARADDAGVAIYQQRNADGSVLLTDRPAPGAVTQRTWKIAPEDAGAAGRREAARRDADDVSRRIGQRLEADDRRAQELTIARLRAAEVRARLDADAAAADAQPLWLVAPRAYGVRGPRQDAPNAPSSAFSGRPPTASIVRGIPLRADGFPIR